MTLTPQKFFFFTLREWSILIIIDLFVRDGGLLWLVLNSESLCKSLCLKFDYWLFWNDNRISDLFLHKIFYNLLFCWEHFFINSIQLFYFILLSIHQIFLTQIITIYLITAFEKKYKQITNYTLNLKYQMLTKSIFNSHRE